MRERERVGRGLVTFGVGGAVGVGGGVLSTTLLINSVFPLLFVFSNNLLFFW